jgi:hypothetical protein
MKCTKHEWKGQTCTVCGLIAHFCDFLTDGRGPCGLPATQGFRCKEHKEKQSPQPKRASRKFSGYSSWREENGQFQSLEDR